MFTNIINNDHGIFEDLLFNMKDSLKESGLQELKEKFLKHDDQESFAIRSSLKEIADCLHDVDYYIELCKSERNLNNYDILDIAQRLINAWREDEALSYLKTFDFNAVLVPEKGYRLLKIKALELSGDYKESQIERHIWFEKSLSVRTYNEILNHSKPELKEEFKRSAIKNALLFDDYVVGLSFLYEIQAFDEASQFVKERINEFTGEEYYTIRPVASSLEKIDSLAATLIYRKLVEPILIKAKSKHYSYAAKDLSRCLLLSKDISEWGDVQPHEYYIQEIVEDNKRKVSFWPKYNEEMQKITKLLSIQGE